MEDNKYHILDCFPCPVDGSFIERKHWAIKKLEEVFPSQVLDLWKTKSQFDAKDYEDKEGIVMQLIDVTKPAIKFASKTMPSSFYMKFKPTIDLDSETYRHFFPKFTRQYDSMDLNHLINEFYVDGSFKRARPEKTKPNPHAEIEAHLNQASIHDLFTYFTVNIYQSCAKKYIQSQPLLDYIFFENINITNHKDKINLFNVMEQALVKYGFNIEDDLYVVVTNYLSSLDTYNDDHNLHNSLFKMGLDCKCDCLSGLAKTRKRAYIDTHISSSYAYGMRKKPDKEDSEETQWN